MPYRAVLKIWFKTKPVVIIKNAVFVHPPDNLFIEGLARVEFIFTSQQVHVLGMGIDEVDGIKWQKAGNQRPGRIGILFAGPVHRVGKDRDMRFLRHAHTDTVDQALGIQHDTFPVDMGSGGKFGCKPEKHIRFEPHAFILCVEYF